MIKRLFTFTAALFLFTTAIFAQVEEGEVFIVSEEEAAAPSDRFVMTYNLGAEYTYAFDLPLYYPIPMYSNWYEIINNISPKLIDKPGSNGHFFRVVNIFEWRRDKLSFTAFANLTLNYIPAFIDTSLMWVPNCIKGGITCFKAAADVWSWALQDGWLLVNLCSVFMAPVVASGFCIFGGLLCFTALPVSIGLLATPMLSIGGSVDYHPYTNNVLDTKLSFGLDIDGYRGMLHAGFVGLFAQAQATASIKNVRLYTQAGYRLDMMNLTNSIKYARSKGQDGYEARFVPAPYIKAGVTWCFGNN